MTDKQHLYLMLSIGALLCAAGMLYFFVTQSFVASFLSMVVAVGFLETRVQLVARSPRTWIFWAHLVSAIPFAISLGALAFWASPLWLEGLADLLAVPMLVFGGMFFWRGIRAALAKGS